MFVRINLRLDFRRQEPTFIIFCAHDAHTIIILNLTYNRKFIIFRRKPPADIEKFLDQSPSANATCTNNSQSRKPTPSLTSTSDGRPRTTTAAPLPDPGFNIIRFNQPRNLASDPGTKKTKPSTERNGIVIVFVPCTPRKRARHVFNILNILWNMYTLPTQNNDKSVGEVLRSRKRRLFTRSEKLNERIDEGERRKIFVATCVTDVIQIGPVIEVINGQSCSRSVGRFMTGC
jgi:hypothetical protein